MKIKKFKTAAIIVFSFFVIFIALIVGAYIGTAISADSYKDLLIPMLSILGTWIAALGTISAVIVSLWLALKQISMDRVVLSCNLNMNIVPSYQDSPCVGLTIVSKGNKPANITSISWLSNTSNPVMLVTKWNQFSNQLPKTLSYGEQINLLHTEGFEGHLKRYVEEHLGGEVKHLKLRVNTTTEVIDVDIPTSMQKHIQGFKGS